MGGVVFDRSVDASIAYLHGCQLAWLLIASARTLNDRPALARDGLP